MQESGSAPVTNGAAAQNPAQGQAGGSAGTKAAPPAGASPAAPRRGDSVVRWLTLAILAVIAIWLVGMLSAMMFGLLTPAQAPRTEAERDLLTLNATVQAGKATSQTYAQYVSVLINAGQLSKAQQALNEALKTAKQDRSFLYAQQAELALAQRDYKGTVAAADLAMAEALKELKDFKAKNVANNRRADAGAILHDSYNTAALAKAQAYLASKDYPNAIKAFDVYIKQSPTDSDVLVQRGLVKVQVGDKKGAEADFRAALKYVPDYQPALDGLKQIGAAQ